MRTESFNDHLKIAHTYQDVTESPAYRYFLDRLQKSGKNYLTSFFNTDWRKLDFYFRSPLAPLRRQDTMINDVMNAELAVFTPSYYRFLVTEQFSPH